jgi:cytochrome c(L)
MPTKLLVSLLASSALVTGCAGHAASSGAQPASSGAPAATSGAQPANPGAEAAANPGAQPTAADTQAAPGGAKKLNRYTGDAAAIQQGRALYLQYGCSGCHGVGGGGGMAPALVDDVWKFGSDDATLFKLIKGQIPEQTMPRVYASLPDDEVWKILAYVRSQYAGDPQKINW